METIQNKIDQKAKELLELLEQNYLENYKTQYSYNEKFKYGTSHLVMKFKNNIHELANKQN